MDKALLTLLCRIDTPSVCNAIEVAQGKRGFNQFTRGAVLASDPKAPAIVGYARTAKIAANKPPSDAPDVIKTRRMSFPAGNANAFPSPVPSPPNRKSLSATNPPPP